MNSFAQRFKYLRENVKHWTQDEAAEALGISRSTIAGYESEHKSRIPRQETLQKIADVFGVSIDFLLGRDNPVRFEYPIKKFERRVISVIDKGSLIESFARSLDIEKKQKVKITDSVRDEMALRAKTKRLTKFEDVVEEPTTNETYNKSTLRMIPIVAEIPCGAPVFTESNVTGTFPVDTSEINLNGGEYVWLRAKGDSMIGAGIKTGSLVLMRLQPEVEDKDIAAVCVDEENATLKRILFVDGSVILMPENPSMTPSSYHKSRIRIVGKAVRVVSEL